MSTRMQTVAHKGPLHTMNYNYKDNCNNDYISIHTSGWYRSVYSKLELQLMPYVALND